MWISPQDEALQAQSAAIIALLISLFGFAWRRNRFWFNFLCVRAIALLVAAIQQNVATSAAAIVPKDDLTEMFLA
jgi:hypothetical protein